MLNKRANQFIRDKMKQAPPAWQYMFKHYFLTSKLPMLSLTKVKWKGSLSILNHPLFQGCLNNWLINLLHFLIGLAFACLPFADSSCIQNWWNPENSSYATRWNAGWDELFSWNNMEGCSKVFTACWYRFEEHWNKWARSLQCSFYSVFFLDGWESWWYDIIYKCLFRFSVLFMTTRLKSLWLLCYT